MAVGVSLGLAAQGNFASRFFPKEPVPEKPASPPIDPTIIQAILNQEGKLTQLQNQIDRLSNELERKDEIIKQQPASPRLKEVDVFELSQVIEANDLASANRHRRELEEQHKVLTHEFMSQLEGELRKLENKYRPTINKVKELESLLEDQRQIQKSEAPARLLWICCQSLIKKLQDSPKLPLENEPAYEMLRKFATNNNQLARKVLEALPAKALKEGVASEVNLVDRFNRIEKLCKRVALVGENGGGVTKYLLSYMQSIFLIDHVNISEDELSGKTLVDPTTWHTCDILARVKHCLRQHNIEQAIRYANQLRGQARVVARDWIRDARIHLETKQAFNILSTYAESVGVNVLHQNNSIN